MPPSYSLLSPTRNYTPTESSSFLLRYSHFNLPKLRSPFFSPHFPPSKRESPFPVSPPFSLSSVSTLKTSRFSHPAHFTSISSFAESESEEDQKHHENAKKEEQEKDIADLPGMAQAFHISSSTASAISICIAFAALSFPFLMSSLGQGLGLKTKMVSYATLLMGFYMAWNIGANDVANAMGTSVGSGALTLRQAVLMAAVLEFSGAMLVGTHVTGTMQNGILVADVFQGKDSLLFAGLVSSLAAAGTWLQVTHFPASLY